MKNIIIKSESNIEVITFERLIRRNACKDGLIWFVENFGKSATKKEIIEKLIKDRPLISLSIYPSHPSWITWLEEETKNYVDINRDEIFIDDVDDKDGLFIAICDHNIQKIYWTGDFYISLELFAFYQTPREKDKSLKGIITKLINNKHTVYMFDNLIEFNGWLFSKLTECAKL